MSADLWEWSLASADDYLTENECSTLLEHGLISDSDEDLLKTFSGAAPKIETGKFFHDDTSITMYPPSPPETKPSPAELASDLLQQLETPYKRENIYSNWLEGKEELTIFENITQVPERVEVPQVALPASTIYPPPQTAPRPTEELLREFETVYDAVELTHLTPPQSPPGPATQLLLTYAQHAQCAPLVPLSSLQIVPPEQWNAAAASTSASISSPTLTEYDCDSQSLEELIRHGAAQLASPQPERSSSPSPHSSPSSSPRSSSTDDDWCVSSRPKPYSRNVDDRRSRKKEQNKNAATRYRQKKKAEVEVLLNEEQALRKRHTDLGEKCSDLQREIRYIKGLMRDLFKAKGLIK